MAGQCRRQSRPHHFRLASAPGYSKDSGPAKHLLNAFKSFSASMIAASIVTPSAALVGGVTQIPGAKAKLVGHFRSIYLFLTVIAKEESSQIHVQRTPREN
jgi:hypothetical protein